MLAEKGSELGARPWLIAGVINVHYYSPADIVIELCLDLPNEHEERTMIVNSSGQILVKTVHDHERGPETGLA
jgi:hypothetical protein